MTLTPVESYWTGHTVNSVPFPTSAASLAYLAWRSNIYPLAPDLLNLWGDHHDDVVLDYGCGPGDDLVGFLVLGKAKRVIGMDVSSTALGLAAQRLGLHDIGARCSLVKVSDGEPIIPLATGSVDYIHCAGVLHHVTHPEAILAEFRRVLRPGGTARIMVYNHDSLFLHLYVAYLQQIEHGIFPGWTAEDWFSRTADGGAPIAIPYRPTDFVGLCADAGFVTAYLGGYFCQIELDLWYAEGARAMLDMRLGAEHREFLLGLGWVNGYPSQNGLPAGLSGVYGLS